MSHNTTRIYNQSRYLTPFRGVEIDIMTHVVPLEGKSITAILKISKIQMA